jgi:hypothetical protein
MIQIRAFKATDEPEACLQFLEGHRKVLEEFNLSNITTNTPLWIHHEGTFVVIAEYQGIIIGGVRMQIADGVFPLPVEDAVAHFDNKIYGLIADKINDGGACELCGLWNARILPPNLGLTIMMSIAAVSLSTKLQTKNIFSICAGYTLLPAMKMGMIVQKSVGNNGEFVYPNSKFKARVLCMNGNTLETTNPEYRDKLLLLRNNPSLATSIMLDNKEMIINYDLKLGKWQKQNSVLI